MMTIAHSGNPSNMAREPLPWEMSETFGNPIGNPIDDLTLGTPFGTLGGCCEPAVHEQPQHNGRGKKTLGENSSEGNPLETIEKLEEPLETIIIWLPQQAIRGSQLTGKPLKKHWKRYQLTTEERELVEESLPLQLRRALHRPRAVRCAARDER